jgi:glutathione peroxidase
MYPNITLTKINGSSINFSSYSNKVLLIINVASFCAHTWQYEMLQNFYKENKHCGFEILAFPCNQFGEQEPKDDASIAEFCHANFSITFDLFSKIDVNGENRCELYKFLTSSNPMQVEDTNVKWNFTKYLVDRDGSVLVRFQPPEFPVKLITKIIRG